MYVHGLKSDYEFLIFKVIERIKVIVKLNERMFKFKIFKYNDLHCN